jgi:hypothetical protein
MQKMVEMGGNDPPSARKNLTSKPMHSLLKMVAAVGFEPTAHSLLLHALVSKTSSLTKLGHATIKKIKYGQFTASSYFSS